LSLAVSKAADAATDERTRARSGPILDAGPLLVTPLGLWLLAAFALPLAIVFLLSIQDGGDMFAPLSLLPSGTQFGHLLGDLYYIRVFASTLGLGAAVTAGCAVLGYPVALWLVRLSPRWRAVGIAAVLVPLLTNVVVRSLGILLVLAPGGVVAGLAALLGFPGLKLQFTWFAVWLALVQVFLPYQILSLYDALQAIDRRIDEAAASLGTPPIRRFFTVTLPLSLGGLRAGMVIVFLLSSTAYVSASLLGGKKVWVSGMIVFEEALHLLNHPLAAALAVLMLIASVLGTLALNRATAWLMPWRAAKPQSRRSWRLNLPRPVRVAFWTLVEIIGTPVAWLLLGLALALLLFPMVLVVVSSVNDSPQATVAAFLGFTWKWYGMILDNTRYIDAFWLSMELALGAVLVALALSLPAAFALVRHRLWAHEAVAASLTLPLALPGIALGLGMLRLLQWFVEIPPFLGLLAVHVVLIAPFTLTMLRTTVAQLDLSLEEAASGLGAPPWRRLVHIVLPQLAPGVAVAGIIGFLISFGEVTVTAFLSTARYQTLPVRIYAEASFSLENTVNAVSTLIILVTVSLLIAVNRFVRLDRVWSR
jgi:putative spermidine/putrescine transport system permease protein